MTTTVSTHNLGASSVGIGYTMYRVGYLVVETGPTTARVELAARRIQGRVALPTGISALHFVVVILARKRIFGAFV